MANRTPIGTSCRSQSKSSRRFRIACSGAPTGRIPISRGTCPMTVSWSISFRTSPPPLNFSASSWSTIQCDYTGPRNHRGGTPMALDKPYTDVPGTTIFDADMSRQGYHLNQFCMSLMKAENRARFKANERAYLDEWPMTEDQKQAVLARDLNRCIELGGNIYFLAKIGATDGKSFQQMAGSMTGMSEEQYREMMVKGGRSIEGNRRTGEKK